MEDVKITLPGLATQRGIDASKSSPMPTEGRSNSFGLQGTARQTVSALTIINPPVTRRAVVINEETDDVLQGGTSTLQPLDITDYDHITRGDIDDITNARQVHSSTQVPVALVSSPESGHRHSTVSLASDTVAVPTSSRHKAVPISISSRTQAAAEPEAQPIIQV